MGTVACICILYGSYDVYNVYNVYNVLCVVTCRNCLDKKRQESCKVSTARCCTCQEVESAPVKPFRCSANTTSLLSAGRAGTVPCRALLFSERCFKLLKFSKHSGISPAGVAHYPRFQLKKSTAVLKINPNRKSVLPLNPVSTERNN
jgi:hypothetical protein